jgi:hypothetical protein
MTWHWYEGSGTLCGSDVMLSRADNRRKALPAKPRGRTCRRCLAATGKNGRPRLELVA